ncbi:MAG: YdcF family protein [Bacteroidota bacterium]
MFFVLSKLLTFFLNPLNWILLCLGYAFWTKRPKQKQRFLGISLLLFLVFTNEFLSNQVVSLWENQTAETTISSDSTYEVAVLLGGYHNSDGKPDDGRFVFGDAANRFTQTLELYQAGRIERILLTGGRSDVLERNEAEAPRASQLLQLLGVPDSAIIVEAQARNTHENAMHTKVYLDSLGYDHCLLITSAFHLHRARGCFDKVQISYDAYPVDFRQIETPLTFNHFLFPNTHVPGAWRMLFKEWIGLLAYKIMGYV